MDNRERFVPVLTVLPEYGNAPFLWLVDDPDEGGVGGMLCDGCAWDDEDDWYASLPLSEGLWRKFADWAIAFDHTAFYSEQFDDSDWDWIVFHARGLQLARWLKEGCGDAYRVVYMKPFEDPNHGLDGRIEILSDGSLRPLPPFPSATPSPPRFCSKIVSGGQTGVDRAALDFAIANEYPHGGWAPKGREAEDGRIALKYQLVELEDGGYRQRTRRNVVDSDGTLIVNTGELDGGTRETSVFARRLGKPAHIVQLDAGITAQVAVDVLSWLRENAVSTLNVAGPREGKRPGLHSMTIDLLTLVDAQNRLIVS